MTVTVGINGFGRIGRCTLAHIAESARNDVQVVKINATGPIETNAHLLRYDSVHGRFAGEIKVDGTTMDLGRGPMQVYSTYDPTELDWSGCDVVLECTGKFNDGEKAKAHLDRGAGILHRKICFMKIVTQRALIEVVLIVSVIAQLEVHVAKPALVGHFATDDKVEI